MKPIEPLTGGDLAELLAEADDQAERDAEAAYDACDAGFGAMTVAAVSPETMREHRATWWVYTGAMVNGRRERIRRQARMRGVWPGYDVTCSCGYETRLGATRGSVARDLLAHRLLAQFQRDRR